jgi:hypothetical protein
MKTIEKIEVIAIIFFATLASYMVISQYYKPNPYAPFTMNAGDQLGKNHYQFVSGNSTYATFMFENGQIFYIKLGADWAVDGGVFKVTKIYESTNHLADQAYIERLS